MATTGWNALARIGRDNYAKLNIVGDVPEITVWVDGELIWSGKDHTRLGSSEGILVALETEFFTVTVEKMRVTRLE